MESVKVLHLDYDDVEKDKLISINPELDYLYFYRFIGGNSSETEGLIEQLSVLREQKPLIIGLFRFPFRFEGKKRFNTAVHQYYRMKELCNAVIYFYSDDLMKLIDDETSILKAHHTFNNVEEQTIQSLKLLLEHTGEVNIDYHDLVTFIQNDQGPLFVHTVEEDTFDIPLKYLVSNPYLPNDFLDGKQLMINLGYSQHVNMETFKQINLRLHDLFAKADLFKVGSYFIDEPGETFKITLIVNGISDPEEQPLDYKKMNKYKGMYHKSQRFVEKVKRRIDIIKD
ncbi:cell division protein FtsZ [Aquisalibacillus elongatus]|uniref:Cell division protein FtsZ n=1 Tax=Aquisalibacillus elongatus TaxID=485577 RepID=A0A3N5BYZ5_9BACI|nr:cell division protein FtsZ [Aquisalibacillus elongatus]RPF51075.1 cell division protein FtsZ [Aquisalibacillus elongatus]